MDFSATLSMRGKTVHGMKRTLRGQISLQGENLTLIGTDLAIRHSPDLSPVRTSTLWI